MYPLIISKRLGIVSNRGHFLLSLPKPRELYELVPKFLRVSRQPPGRHQPLQRARLPLSRRPRVGASRPNRELEATRLLVWYVPDLRLNAILLESEHCVLLLGPSEVGAPREALHVS